MVASLTPDPSPRRGDGGIFGPICRRSHVVLCGSAEVAPGTISGWNVEALAGKAGLRVARSVILQYSTAISIDMTSVAVVAAMLIQRIELPSLGPKSATTTAAA